MRIKYFYLFLVMMMITSCHKDVDDDSLNTESETQITIPYVFQEIEGSIIGYVFGDDNQPIQDAIVSTYSGSSSTNEYGVFHLKDVKMDGQGTLLRVTKDGYFEGSDFIYPNDNGSGSARIKLIRTTEFSDFDSDVGGSVEFADEGLVSFNANSIADQNGSSYTGVVNAYVRGFYPKDEDYDDASSGGLLGVDLQGRTRALAVYGSVVVTAQAQSGAPLQMKSEQRFTIQFPIDQSQSTFNSSVVLWKYDALTGFWEEVGVATKEGAYYSADISEFGTYMFADPYALVHFCARLVDNIGLPVKNHKFKIYTEDKLTGMGISDDDGFICSKLPADQELKIDIIHPICGDILVTKNVGPFSTPTNEGDILVGAESKLRSGAIYCDGAPVSDALIVIRNEENTIVRSTDDDGLFNINLDEIECSEGQSFEIFAVRNNDMSPVLETSSTNTSDLMFEICKSDCAFEISFVFEKEDYCTSGAYSFVTAEVAGGSGAFRFDWSDGSQEVSSSAIVIGAESCVTVTDLSSGCMSEYCELIEEYTRLELVDAFSFNNLCTQDGGSMTLSTLGGTEPYTYEWIGDDQYMSNLASPENVPPGTYQVLVSDANGCEVNTEVEVYDVTRPLESAIVDFCDYSTIDLVDLEGYAPFIYSWSWDGGSAETSSIAIDAPGAYSVTVSDVNGCIRSKSFQILSVGANFDFNPITSCLEGEIFFGNLNPDYHYFYQDLGSGEIVDLDQNVGQAIVPIVESGYTYAFGAQDVALGCQEIETITLPHFEGLQIENIENTSCDSCTDGSIIVLLDNNQECSGGCMVGEVIIIDKLTGEEVTTINEQSEMGAGTYIVIVTDENTGCYIAHQEVEIE